MAHNRLNNSSNDEDGCDSVSGSCSSPGSSFLVDAASPDPDLLEAYHDLMRSRLPSMSPVREGLDSSGPLPMSGEHGAELDPQEGDRPLSRAEKQNAKKKRRKERERMEREAKAAVEAGRENLVARASSEHGLGDVDHEAMIDFPLFSGSPIRAIRVQPAPEVYPLPDNPRHLPLAPGAADRVRQTAQDVAASCGFGHRTLELSHEPPSVDRPGPPAGPERILRLSQLANTSLSARNLLHIIIIDESADRIIPTRTNVKAPASTIQRVTAISPSPMSARKPSHRERRRLTSLARPKNVARSWAPPVSLGGKARGYGMGYRSSQEGRREVHEPYLRGT